MHDGTHANESANVQNTVCVRKRCALCSRKLSVASFACRCGDSFCPTHTEPRQHACTFDYKEGARRELSKNNPVISVDQLNTDTSRRL